MSHDRKDVLLRRPARFILVYLYQQLFWNIRQEAFKKIFNNRLSIFGFRIAFHCKKPLMADQQLGMATATES